MIYLISLFIALGVAGAEAVTYSGLIHKHLGIDSSIIYLISMGLSFTHYKFPKIFTLMFGIFSYAIAIIYIVLVFLEKTVYPNYIFTVTHINLLTFLLFVGLTWFHYLRTKKVGFVKSLLIASIIYVGINGTGRMLAIVYSQIRRIVTNPFATYDQKMTSAYSGFYLAMKEVVKLTPDDAIILIPPQGNPWEVEGNGAMVTYFVYPRKVRNLTIDDMPEIYKNNTYILIARGSWERKGSVDYGWPKTPVKASMLWQIDLDKKINYKYERDYNPEKDKWDWGLIEVLHE